MGKRDWNKVWLFARKYLINKYFITCAGFAVVLCFCGDQSLISRTKMYFQERAKKKELREYEAKIAEVEAATKMLQDKDSLERYARETYYMHADNEDVYIINDAQGAN